MNPPLLTFAALNARIDALPEHTLASGKVLPKARWAYATGMVAAALGLLAAKLLPGNVYTLAFASTMLAIELAGLSIAVYLQLPREALTFRRARNELAEQLDFDLPHHLALIEWLQGFPRERLATLGEFAAHRHQRMQEKLPLLTGSLDRLGAWPLIAALYLQFKDARWPPHPSWAELLLIFALLLLYWLSLLQINVRLRLQLCGNLLAKALPPQDTAAPT